MRVVRIMFCIGEKEMVDSDTGAGALTAVKKKSAENDGRFRQVRFTGGSGMKRAEDQQGCSAYDLSG